MELDSSIIKIIKDCIQKGQPVSYAYTSVFNKVIETDDNLSFDGLPVSWILKTDIKKGLNDALEVLGITGNNSSLTKWQKYEKNKIIMEDGDCVPQSSNVNQIQNVIDNLKSKNGYDSLVCILKNPALEENNKCYAIEFYHRKAVQDYTKAHPSPDHLDIKFIQNSCSVLDELTNSIVTTAFIQKIVALCSGLLPGKLYGSLGDCYMTKDDFECSKDLFNKYRSVYYRCNPPKYATFRNSFYQIKVNNNLIDKWRSRIPEVLPTLSDFAKDGSDFELIGELN